MNMLRIAALALIARLSVLGGPGSGNFGHLGRPGEVGGSSPTGGEAQPGSKEWMADATKLSGAKGSNEGGLYKDAIGRKYYVKKYKDPDQAASEQVANAVYKSVGARVPETHLGEGGVLASEWMEGAQTLNQVGLTKERADEILDHFAADVLVMNWDVVGTGHDNILYQPGRGGVRGDQGGSLLHRAQGALKPEGLLDKIGEWDTLPSPSMNTYYAQVFKKAGVSHADALGARAVSQIDAIERAAAGGWAKLVERAAPKASAAFKAKATAMLEKRTAGLLSKREALKSKLKFLGGPGSGNFGHEGRPGQVGGSAPDGDGPGSPDKSEKPFAKKAKGAKVEKHHLEKMAEMKKAGASMSQIEAATGISPSLQLYYHPKAKPAAPAVEVKAPEPPSPALSVPDAGGKFSGGDSGIHEIEITGGKTYTKEQLTKVVEMKKLGYNGQAILKETGVPVGSQSHHWGKYQKAEAAAKAALGEGAVKSGFPQVESSVKGTGGIPSQEQYQAHWTAQSTGLSAAQNLAESKGYATYKANSVINQLNSGKTPAQVEKKTGVSPEHQKQFVEAYNKNYSESLKTQGMDATYGAVKPPASSGYVAIKPGGTTTAISHDAEKLGYQWKEKTSGPNAGKYAWFKDGIQQSAPFPSTEKDAAAKTMHHGAGPQKPIDLTPGPTPEGWPISNETTRAMGTKYVEVMDSQGHAWSGKLTSAEKTTIKAYTGSAYSEMNSALRKNPNYTSDRINGVKSALAKGQTPPPPELVWRGVSSLPPGLHEGSEIRMDGFQSTSINPAFAQSWKSGHVLEIKPAKGGAYVKTISSHTHEMEYLLPHGAKYKVLGSTKIKVSTPGYSKQQVMTVWQLEMHPHDPGE